MAAVGRYLAADEHLVLEVRRHMVVLAGSFASFLAAIVVAIIVGFVTSPDRDSDFVDLLAGLVSLFFALRFGWDAWQWWVDRVIVTDQRIFEVSGVLTRKVASMPIGKVTDMTYRRTLPGRVLGYGDLIFETAGQDQAFGSITRVPRPDDFYRTVTSLVAARKPAPAAVAEKVKSIFDEEDTGPLPRVIV